MGKNTSTLRLKKNDVNDALDDLAYELFKKWDRKAISYVSDIMCLLNNMGYVDIKDAKDVVKCIDDNHLDVSLFTFPYNISYSEFKQRALVGEYDVLSAIATAEEIRSVEDAVKAGKLKKFVSVGR